MFEINTDDFKAAVRRFQDGSRSLQRNAYEIEDVKYLLQGISCMGPIIGSLSALEDNVRLEARQEGALYDTGIRIARRYDDCEEEIMDNMDNDKFRINLPVYTLTGFVRDIGNRKIDHRILDEILDLFD